MLGTPSIRRLAKVTPDVRRTSDESAVTTVNEQLAQQDFTTFVPLVWYSVSVFFLRPPTHQ